MKEKSKLFVVDGSLVLPLPYCLLSVLISRPPFSHLKEIVLLDPPLLQPAPFLPASLRHSPLSSFVILQQCSRGKLRELATRKTI